MKKTNELDYKDLKEVCNPSMFKFKTTEELEGTKEVVYGQERGIKALEFGVQVDAKGYNLFVEGPSGVGKTIYTRNYLRKISKKKKIPHDWCYIYNFDNTNEPIAVSFPAGQGKEFKKAMSDFVKDIKLDIKRTLNNEYFEKEKKLIKSNNNRLHCQSNQKFPFQ